MNKARYKAKQSPQSESDLFSSICKTSLKTACLKEYRFHPTRRWRFDYALPEHLIALEVEGGIWTKGRHIRPQGFLGDMEKYNAAALLGWRVLRTTPEALLKTKTLEMLQEAIQSDRK